MNLSDLINKEMASVILRNKVISRILKFARWILLVAAIIFLLVAGFGIFSTILVAIALMLAISFGSAGKLAGSFIIAVLTKTFLESFTTVFVAFGSPIINALIVVIAGMSWIHLMVIIFVFVYSLSFITSNIKLFNFNIENKINE